MITVFGGILRYSVYLASVESFTPLETNSHCPAITKLPDERYGHIAQIIQGKTVVCGGYTSAWEKTCLNYEAGTWSSTKPMTQARDYASSILLSDGSMLITGGYGGSSSKTTLEIWTEHATMEETKTMTLPEEMAEHCMVLISTSQVLLAGNYYGDRKSSYLLNITSWPFTFTERIPLSTGRRGAACGLLKNYGVHKNLPIVAGGSGGSTFHKTTEVLINGRWETGPTLPRGFYSGGYTNVDEFFLIGGWDGSQVRKDVMMYDEENQIFKITEGKMETGRESTAATITSTDQCN